MGRNEIALYSVLGCAVILSPSTTTTGGVLATNYDGVKIGVADAAVPNPTIEIIYLTL